uniref:Uncharacterized protein n=1 Tax=Glossina pallidipes TaxID=7398 RepID=A0A1B0A3S7_GLOPL
MNMIDEQSDAAYNVEQIIVIYSLHRESIFVALFLKDYSSSLSLQLFFFVVFSEGATMKDSHSSLEINFRKTAFRIHHNIPAMTARSRSILHTAAMTLTLLAYIVVAELLTAVKVMTGALAFLVKVQGELEVPFEAIASSKRGEYYPKTLLAPAHWHDIEVGDLGTEDEQLGYIY